MSDFYGALADLAQMLAERQAQDEAAQQVPSSDLTGMGSPSTSPLDALFGGGLSDPVYAGLFGGSSSSPTVAGYDAGGGGGPTGALRTVHGVTMIAPAIRSLLQARRATGDPLFANVESSYRTRAEQAALYQAYLNGTGNLAAKPGTSLHETGNAVDISSGFLSQNPDLVRWLLAHGWDRSVGGEPWHFTYGS